MYSKIFAATLLAVVAANPKPPENYLLAGCVQTNSKTLNCEALQISNVPTDIPDAIEKLLLKNNIINDNTGTVLPRCVASTDPCGSGALQAGNLVNLPGSVREVQLQANGITAIADNAFATVGANLEILRIFANEMSEIKAGAFNGLGSLTTLYLNNNPNLAAIRSGAFSAFAATLSELFAKDNDALTVIEDNSVNALSFRPIFIDMTTSLGSLCAISPPKMVDGSLVDGSITCACAEDAGLTGGTEGFCILSDAPTNSPTKSPVSSAPTTATPTTVAPVTSAPVSSAPTTGNPTPPPTNPTTTADTEQNRVTDAPDTEQNRVTDAPETVVAAKGMGKGKNSATNEGGEQYRGENGEVGKKGGKGKKEGKGENGGGNGNPDNRVDGQSSTAGEEAVTTTMAATTISNNNQGSGEQDKLGNNNEGSYNQGSKNKGSKHKGEGGSKGSKAGKMTMGDVNFQPVGDLEENVKLNGAKGGSWSAVGLSGVVVFVVGAALVVSHRRAQKVSEYAEVPVNDLIANERTQIVGDETSFGSIKPVLDNDE